MQTMTLVLPAMYADHHVMSVRKTLTDTPGVIDVQASAARRSVLVRYDEEQVSEDRLVSALAEAGYQSDEHIESGDFPMPHQDGSAWHTVIGRTTTTITKDREMAGDFRRY